MSYTRPPQVTIAGMGMVQSPAASVVSPAGIVPVTLSANISSTSSLGIVQIGDGLSITSAGVLSATSGCNTIQVKLTAVSYTATASDSYIGATNHDIVVTLPVGSLGRVYYVKNQATGNITVQGSSGQKIDGNASLGLATNQGCQLVFDGTQWNSI